MLAWLRKLLHPPQKLSRTFPPFPTLTLEPNDWRGTDSLQAFSDFQLPERILITTPGNATLSFPRPTNDSDTNPATPVPELAAAFTHLHDYATEIKNALLPALQQYLNDRHFPIASLAQFQSLFELAYISILPVAKEGYAYATLTFDTAWDIDHPFHVLIHRSRIVELDTDNDDIPAALKDGGDFLPAYTPKISTYRFGPKAGQPIIPPSPEQKPTDA